MLGNTYIVQLLIKSYPDLLDKDGCNPVFKTSLIGHTDIVTLLLEKNLINVYFNNCIHYKHTLRHLTNPNYYYLIIWIHRYMYKIMFVDRQHIMPFIL